MLQSRLQLGLLFVTLILLGLGTAWYWSYSQDDVYITYRYARNIATGVGFVFNAGEAVQGTTTPLFALLMALVYRFTPNVMLAGNLISALSLAGTCLFTFWLGRRLAGPWLGWGAVLALALNPLCYTAFGMETLTYLLLAQAAFWFAYQRQAALAGLAAGLLAITRPDGVLVALVLGLAAWVVQRRVPWRGVGVLVLVAGSWYLYAWFTFGSPLPQTYQAKVAPFSGWLFVQGGWELWQAWFVRYSPVFWLAPGLWLVGVVVSARRRSYLVVLWVWSVLYGVGYTILNVSMFWYYVPLLPPVLLTIGYGAGVVWHWLRQVGVGRVGRSALASGVITLSLIAQAASAYALAPAPERVETYRLVGEWLKANTPAQAQVLVADLGVLGWYGERPTIDTFGLVVPGMYHHTETYAVLKYRSDYLVATQYWSWAQVLPTSWLQQNYQRVAQISTPGDTDFSPMIVYKRRYPIPTLGPPFVWQGWQVQPGLPATAVRGSTIPLVFQLTAPAHTRTLTWSVCLQTDVSPARVLAAQPLWQGLYPTPAALGAEQLFEVIWVTLDVPVTATVAQLGLGPDCASPAINLGTIQLRPAPQPGPDLPFGNILRLQAFDLPAGSYWAGGEVPLTLYWHTQATPAHDVSVFVHLLDAQGQLVAQSDGWPAGLPAALLTPNQTLVDIRSLLLPPNLPPGDYELRVGVYNPATGARLALPNGAEHLTLARTLSVQWPGGSGLP